MEIDISVSAAREFTLFLFQSEYRIALNGMAGMIYISPLIPGAVVPVLIEAWSEESLEDMDGLGNFEEGRYRLSTGEIRSDSIGFIDSWR